MEKNEKILIVAGHGGHSGYAFAIVNELFKLGYMNNIIIITKGYDFLIEKFKKYGEVFTQILPRKTGEATYRGIHRWIIALYQSYKIMSKYDIKAVFLTGSNFSIPSSLISKLKKIPIFTIEAIEHFKKPSKAIKVLESIGSIVFIHWKEQIEIYPKGKLVGPVYEPPLYTPKDEGYVLVTTGTIGYKELFDEIEKLGFERVVLQTGNINPNIYLKRNPKWIVFNYTSDIHKWIAGANLIITQQGLTAAVSKLAYGKPTIIVWNPKIKFGAIKQDVKIYAKKLKVPFIEKPSLLNDNVLEEAKSTNIKIPNGAEKIARILLNITRII
ncbi:MAG: glycosyltransferase [Candidatus Aenigmatarchaeota archaeon]